MNMKAMSSSTIKQEDVKEDDLTNNNNDNNRNNNNKNNNRNVTNNNNNNINNSNGPHEDDNEYLNNDDDNNGNEGTTTPATLTAIVAGGPEIGNRTIKSLKRVLGKLWRRHRGNASITEYDPSYKVAYLGNVLTGWAKGEGCVEKPVSTLWRNYVSSSRPDVSMRLTVTNGGLTATTKDHGLTEYWAHRVTYCTAPQSHPRLFVWVYRHEGRRLRPELRCHAALCSKESTARRLATVLNARLHQALLEFRRDKVSRQNARLSLANAVYENPSLPRRKILLSTGGSNYRPPLERSKSAPKLSAIEEDADAEEIEQQRFLDELNSLKNAVERNCWQDQESWRLARLLDALNRESSDENASISSGCETASTANSEERVSATEESSSSAMNSITSVSTTTTMSNPTMIPRNQDQDEDGCENELAGPRRNSDGSPNFMTCTGSPRFRRCSKFRTSIRRKRSYSEDESQEDEEFEELESPEENEECCEDDFANNDSIVDYRPRGECPTIKSWPNISSNIIAKPLDELDNGSVDSVNLRTLGSLDEEDAADSDESGYVEASPKSSMDRTEIRSKKEEPEIVQVTPKIQPAMPKVKVLNNEDKKQQLHHQLQHENNKKNVEAEFTRCQISDTIKKLANASLRSSRQIRPPIKTETNVELSSNGLITAGQNGYEIEGESPSLLQRKQLLAQRGIAV